MTRVLSIIVVFSLFLFVSLPSAFAHEGHVHTATDEASPVVATSVSSSTELDTVNKQIWIYVSIAFAGIIVGSLGTFILLTVSLHPKK